MLGVEQKILESYFMYGERIFCEHNEADEVILEKPGDIIPSHGRHKNHQ